MAKCAYCGSLILLGGNTDGALRFCNATCQTKGAFLRFADQLTPELVEAELRAVFAGACPKCHGPGPVDVHTSYRVWSALVVTQWQSRPALSCARCGWKAKLGDFIFCLFLGWWGFPWGLGATPMQLARNLYGLAFPKKITAPSDKLRQIIRAHLAAQQARAAQAAPPLIKPPPIPAPR